MVSFKVLSLVLLVALVTVDAKKGRPCPAKAKASRLEKLKEKLGSLVEAKVEIESGEVDCDDFTDNPGYKFFTKLGKGADCDVEAEEATDMEDSCSAVYCGLKKFEDKIAEFQGNLENAAEGATCQSLTVKGVVRGLFLLKHGIDKTKEELKQIKEEEKAAKKAAAAARKAAREAKKAAKKKEKEGQGNNGEEEGEEEGGED